MNVVAGVAKPIPQQQVGVNKTPSRCTGSYGWAAACRNGRTPLAMRPEPGSNPVNLGGATMDNVGLVGANEKGVFERNKKGKLQRGNACAQLGAIPAQLRGEVAGIDPNARLEDLSLKSE